LPPSLSITFLFCPPLPTLKRMPKQEQRIRVTGCSIFHSVSYLLRGFFQTRLDVLLGLGKRKRERNSAGPVFFRFSRDRHFQGHFPGRPQDLKLVFDKSDPRRSRGAGSRASFLVRRPFLLLCWKTRRRGSLFCASQDSPPFRGFSADAHS